jgi:hypothetical protein
VIAHFDLIRKLNRDGSLFDQGHPRYRAAWKKAADQLLQVTIPEALNFNSVFDDTFSHYLRTLSGEGVKSIAMGSMFRLSFKVRMKDPAEEKAFIDELRTKNGNLEIALLPYVTAHTTL